MDLKGLKLTWLGHATFRAHTTDGKVVIFDPFLKTNPKCPDNEKTQKQADYLVITHGHSDHTADAVELARAHKSKVVAMIELCAWLNRKGIETCLPMNKGGTQQVDKLKVTMVHAEHSSSVEDDGQLIYTGDPAGIIVQFENGVKIFHAGDTCVFGDMALIHELYQPDLALLPIGDHFTMGPKEAAVACRLLKPKAVVPMHYGTWPLLTGTPEAFKKELTGQKIEIIEMKPGQTIG